MKNIVGIVLILGFLFVGCGGGGGDSAPLPTTKVLTVDDNVSVGTPIDKIDIPIESNDEIQSITLEGEGSEKFSISTSGEITTNGPLFSKENITTQKTSKQLEKVYALQVVIRYKSGKTFTIDISIKVYSYIEVDSDNTPPIANSQSLTLNEDTNKTITLVGTDSDGDNLRYSIVSQPMHGVISGVLPNIVYTPTANYFGEDSFQFKVNDTKVDSNIATISLTILDVIEPNVAPLLSGTPKTTTNIYSIYQFLPKASDVNGDQLTFSIQNKPSWAIFNTTTGLLQGVPSSEGIYSNIIISVSDANQTVSLEPFSIEVLAAVDLAHTFGIATQGTGIDYYYYKAASNVIDQNVSTYNETRGDVNENWWQIQLPSPTKVHKIVIQPISAWWRDLNGASLYLSDLPYDGDVSKLTKVATLGGGVNTLIIDFPESKSGTYLFIKQLDSEILNLASVEVYGETPPAPVFLSHDSTYLIPGASTIGYNIATLGAVDYQGDTIEYTIDDPHFTVDENGNIRVNSALQSGVYETVVTITDGVNSTSTNLTITATASNAVEDALSSGKVDLVTDQELIASAREELELLRTKESLLTLLYENNAISYTPGQSSQIINIVGDVHKTYSILNGVANKTLAIAGTKFNARFAAFGSVPMNFFQNGTNLEYEIPMKRLLLWLIAGEPLNSTIEAENKIVVLSFASYATNIKNWLVAKYPNWTIKECTDIATHASCISGANLIIQGSNASDINANIIKADLEIELNKGTPLLYLHPDWGVNATAEAMAKLFEFSLPYGGNWWANDKAEWTDSSAMKLAEFNSNYGALDIMLAHFQDRNYNFDWSVCKDDDGNLGEKYDNCEDVVGLNSDFQLGATKVRTFMTGLDSNKNNIFTTNDYRLHKLLALIGDKFRQNVVYPMDKVTTDDNEFMKSYYSDHAIYNYRAINPTQPNMGNFSRSDFSHITPISKTINVISKQYFRSTGAYALPGQTVRVTRNDSSDLSVKVFINSLRSGATHQYQPNGYNRPKYLQTPHFELKPGETIEFTSSYGGPIQLEFSKNDLPVEVKFDNVGEHAYWASSADNASFSSKLNAGDFDWAEISTSGFEVHSTLEKMRTSVADPNWGTAEDLANGTKLYMSNYPHVLAGFQGVGIDVVPEIHDFATTNSLTIETLDIVKHMNADQALCGYGCSGNPYDAYWAFNPIGHGDVHELGHGLQVYRLQFDGFPNHAATNYYSYYTKSRYFDNTGNNNDCGGQPFKEVFEKLQASVNEVDPITYLKTNLWDTAGLGEQYVLVLQAMMHAQKMNKLANGWHLLARVHILEREIKRARVDWDNKKASIGFSNYTIEEFDAMSANDWLVISYSFAVGLDYRNFFDMMGIEYSQKARDQIASFGYEVVPNKYFVSTDTGYCSSDEYGTLFDRSTLDVDGITVYPY